MYKHGRLFLEQKIEKIEKINWGESINDEQFTAIV